METRPKQGVAGDLLLKPLLRHHAPGLDVAETLIRSAGEGPEERRAALTRFQETWKTVLSGHLEDEDKLLSPLLQLPEDRRRLLREHRLFRTMYGESLLLWVQADPDSLWVENLGTRLRAHIRWEDTYVYPQVRQRFAPERIERLVADVRKSMVRRLTTLPPGAGKKTADRRPNP